MTFEEFQRQSQLIEREMMATDAQVMADDISFMSAAYNPETGLIEEEYEDIEEAQILEEKTTSNPEPMQTKSTGDTVINLNLGGKSEPKPVKEDPANTKTAIWIGMVVIVLIVLALIALKLFKKKGG